MKERTKEDLEQRAISDSNLTIYDKNGRVIGEFIDGVWTPREPRLEDAPKS